MLQKHGFEGPGLCFLCGTSEETSSHLFASCSYAGMVWKGVVNRLDANRAHEAIGTLEEKTKAWWSDEKVDQFEAFPILYVYSIWEARNKAIFNNTWVTPDTVIPLIFNKIHEHKKDSTRNKTRIIREPEINKEMPWDFFDGASQGDPPLGGAGAVIFFSATKKKKT